MTAILKQFQATLPSASVKAIEEICVTCGGAHSYYQCLAIDGNTFPELRNNIQGYVPAAAVNYNQGSGHLPSKTITNPKGELKDITTRSGIVLDGPFVPIPPSFINPEEDKRKLGLPELIFTRMTLELANRAICTPAGIARDVFIPVGKFTFPANFVIVDYESDTRVPLILGRPFLRTTRTLIDVHGEEMILRNDDERLTLNMRHGTSSYSNQPKKESVNMINICDDSNDVFDLDHVLKPFFPSPILVEDNNSFLDKSDTSLSYSDISFPEFETFIIHTEETNSGSTTTHSDISLQDYEAFYFDDGHIEEISSGSTTTHSDISLSKYDSDLPDPGELISIFNSEIRENSPSTTCVNLPVEDDHSPLLAYVVWIFLAYLTYPVIPPYLHSFGNEDTIFDPGITINHFYSFKPGLSHWCGAFKKFNTHRSHLNECPMIINGMNTPILDVLLFHFYPP
nr:reverse transcriptase domain-containing protein [Tanacetum cinerariifolium]